MTQPERVEALMLGSGFGGKLLAWHLARSGRRTAVVERRWIGGSCPNIACLPSKNEIWSARIAHLARHAAQFGAMITGPVRTDMAKVRQRKREMVDREIALHLQNYKSSGAELILGSGRFVAPKTLEVRLNDGSTRALAADQVFLNLGTHAAIPGVPGLEAARPLTHIEALELDYLPSHLIVLGGGYVGLEMAQAYRRFGSHVTVIEHGPQLMAREDPDVADEVRRILSDEGIGFLIGAEILNVNGRSGEEINVAVRTASGERQIQGSNILAATGRIPNTAGIGLDEAGVELDAHGYIRVNERLETTAAGVWAIGALAGGCPKPLEVVAGSAMRASLVANLVGCRRDPRLAKVKLAPIYCHDTIIAITERSLMIKLTGTKRGAKFGCHSAANPRFGDQNSAVGRLSQISPSCSYH